MKKQIKATAMKNFNSACTFSFTIDHNHEDCDDISNEEIITAIRARLKMIEEHDINEIREAVLPPYDTVENI